MLLLLREHGYAVDPGELYYAETKQRVEVEISPALMTRTLKIAREAREVALRLVPPPPLQASSKCARCSLVVSKYREEVVSVRQIDVLNISLFGNVQVTAQALRTLFDSGINVFHFSYGGWLQARPPGCRRRT